MSRFAAVCAALLFVTPTLTAQSSEFGEWKTLFNGHDLTGWMAAKPGHDNPRHHKNVWKAENGAMTNGGPKKNDICTVEVFRDYELEVEYKIPPGSNSGVYLRGQIEIQVLDSYGKPDDKLSNADCGAVYGGPFVALRNTQYPPGEWNTYRVLHVGHRITVWHNGVLIQDDIYNPNASGGNMTKHLSEKDNLTPREGPLMFQGDHGHVWYRNVRIRPLFTAGSGWRPLFDGASLKGFNSDGKDAGEYWAVEDHAFTNKKYGGDGRDIWTDEEFGNFLVYYSYKSDPTVEHGNSGFYLRDQWELQIHSGRSITDTHRDGSLYSIYAPLATPTHAPKQWNHMFVKLDGKQIWAWENGQLIHNGRVCATRTDNHGTPTPDFTKDSFKFQGDHGKVTFGELWIKPLPDSQPGN